MKYYDKNYFDWQQSIGVLSGSANLFMYEPYVGKDDVVLDFGCGGGYLLAQLACGRRFGVEINPAARAVARSQGVSAVADIVELGDLAADVIISSHALEHTHNPFDVLRSLHGALRTGGRLVVVTPFERGARWAPDDINRHLYTWSPMNLGNLVSEAGFRVDSAEVIHHRFPPKAPLLRKVFGPSVFHLICMTWGRVSRSVVQVRVVATKE